MITHGVLDALDMLVKTCVPRNPLIGLCQRGPLGPRKAIRCFNAKTSFEENEGQLGIHLWRWPYEGNTGRRDDFSRFLSRGRSR